jgi:predicted transposase/invertase (TIGR01784 family)
LIDLSRFSDEEIKTVFFTKTALKIALLVQKYIYQPARLKQYLNDFFKLGILYFREEEGLRFLESVCRYIYCATEIEAEEILKTVEYLPNGAEETVMTTAERLRKEGKKEGQKEGWERGQKEARLEDARRMLEEGLDVNLIIKITGLSRDEVEKLKHKE